MFDKTGILAARKSQQMIFSDYSPIKDGNGNPKHFNDISYLDLHQLIRNEIQEGFSVEYKESFTDEVKQKIPKIITSFANEMGGWLFVGVRQIGLTRRARNVSNKKYLINLIENQDFEAIVVDVLKSKVSPTPYYNIKFLSPKNDPHHGVLVIWVPEGEDPPYISAGTIFQRTGSSSDPVKVIENRYYLDRLFSKKQDFERELKDFCKKEISVHNVVISHGIQRDYGMCNVYILPEKYMHDLRLLHVEDIIKTIKEFCDQRSFADIKGAPIDVSVPFPHHLISSHSIIFRNKWNFDSHTRSVAWEQYLDGRAKIHIPIPYLDKDASSKMMRIACSNYDNEEVFDYFEYINALNFFMELLGTLKNYLKCISCLTQPVKRVKIVIELDNVRKDVLFFQNAEFPSFISRNGMPFSDKESFIFGIDSGYQFVDYQNYAWYYVVIHDVIRAFGYKMDEFIDLLFADVQLADST
ncbi:putative DNA-binding domain protein [anaerobic digester metagenome]